MARIAVVSVSMTKPKCNGAAEFAFKVNVVCSMLLAILLSSSNNFWWALWAHQVFFSVILHHLLIISAVFHASKVWWFALEAHIVRHLEHREILKFSIEVVSGLFESFMFVKAFILRTFDCLSFNHISDFFNGIESWSERLTMIKLHLLLATRAVHEAKHYTWWGPFGFDYGFYTVHVEDVATA